MSESAPTTEEWAPATFRVIDDAESLKAIGDPLRMRILELMMVANKRTWSVKEVAAELGQPVTKLYHHVKLLESAAFIKDVESRIVSGIVEHRYRASQRSLRFDDSLFISDETRHDSIAQVNALLESVREDLMDYLYREDVDYDLVSLSRMTSRLTPEEVTEVNDMIDGMVAKFQANRDAIDRSHLPRTQIVFMMSPLGHDPGE